MRRDPVTKEVSLAVRHRDLKAMADAGLKPLRIICVAPVIDPTELGNCWGRTTLDHIKAEPRAGVRAKSDELHLVSLCQGHTEDGRKAGHQWNTAHRPELREYLARTTWACPRCSVINVLGQCWFCGSVRQSTGAPLAGADASAAMRQSEEPGRQRPF